MSELSTSDICTRAIPPAPTVACEGDFHMDQTCRRACELVRSNTLIAQQNVLCILYSTYRASMQQQLNSLEAALADCKDHCTDDACKAACDAQWGPQIRQLQLSWALFREALNTSWNQAVSAANAAYTTCATNCCQAN